MVVLDATGAAQDVVADNPSNLGSQQNPKSLSQKVWHGFATRVLHRLKTGVTKVNGIGVKPTLCKLWNRQRRGYWFCRALAGRACRTLRLRSESNGSHA